MLTTQGIHHVSSTVGHGQRNIDFYSGVLGLRLVKQTLNYDDAQQFHLYFGNQDGSTGLTTTFPMPGAREGVIGDGQVGFVTHAVPIASFPFWEKRLDQFGIEHYRYKRFGTERLAFKDTDGLELEFVASELGAKNHWTFNGVKEAFTITGIASATLFSRWPKETLEVLTDILGYQLVSEDEEGYQLRINDELGGELYLQNKPHEAGRGGIGTVHHIAFKVADNTIDDWVDYLREMGYQPTEVKDRFYFKSVYFREPGGILIELATLSPGVLADEKSDDLGSHLIIPAHYKDQEREIVEHMMPLFVREVSSLDDYGYRNRAEYDLLEERKNLRQDYLKLKKIKNERQLTETEELRLLEVKEGLKQSLSPEGNWTVGRNI
ncbi:VOC family protein [Bavariicoccus seileri]|uniref:VOC family protein n=1 Tax=Bavariicoccus seileri TaxID=549685 RepID=UPI003F9175F5